jgi:hypothetical protein
MSLRTSLLLAATLVAFYLPSSIDGEILRSLTIVALVSTCGLLAALLVVGPGLGPPHMTAAAIGIMALLFVFTVVSPFSEISPGAIFVYLAIALLYVQNLRDENPRYLAAFFVAINVSSLVLGFATAFDAPAADWLLTTYYNAFYAELLTNMVVLNDKPVLTFATHSMAGFMIYLLFHMNWVTFERQGRRLFLAFAIGHIALLVWLASTTGTVYAALAVVQVAWSVGRRHVRIAVPAVGLAAAVAIGVLLLEGTLWARVVDEVRTAILGDRVRGLVSRYAVDGLLAGNVAFLTQHPLEPVGFGFSERLYYGDSGYIVNMLRGSVPLVVLMYLGLWGFLRGNLRSTRTANWIYIVILAFELGFTPLQYFRFVGFAPFMIAYFNSLEPSEGS